MVAHSQNAWWGVSLPYVLIHETLLTGPCWLLSMILLKRRPWSISGVDSHISALSKPLGLHCQPRYIMYEAIFCSVGVISPSGMGSDVHTSCLPAVGPSLKWIQTIWSQAVLQLQPPRRFLFRNSSKTLGLLIAPGAYLSIKMPLGICNVGKPLH